MSWMALMALPAAALWLAVLVVPWRPAGTRERLAVADGDADAELPAITAIVPARNEAAVLARSLAALRGQPGLERIIVVDDGSADGTGELARALDLPGLEVIDGRPTPAGWTGKPWALEQARSRVTTPLTLLLDADVALAPGMLGALYRRKRARDAGLVSVMVELRMVGLWERLLIPAFVYYFKLLYPFSLSNRGSRHVAAAAGGCVLVDTALLTRIGGFAAIRAALIDDCTLARAARDAGAGTWVGLTHGAHSLRGYPGLGGIWAMIARSAYPQLRCSPALLAGCTVAFALAYFAPLAALAGDTLARAAGSLALAAMAASYWPTLRYYERSPLWALALPLIAALYLAMTWSSAWAHWRGRGASWKGRTYAYKARSDDEGGTAGGSEHL